MWSPGSWFLEASTGTIDVVGHEDDEGEEAHEDGEDSGELASSEPIVQDVSPSIDHPEADGKHEEDGGGLEDIDDDLFHGV